MGTSEQKVMTESISSWEQTGQALGCFSMAAVRALELTFGLTLPLCTFTWSLPSWGTEILGSLAQLEQRQQMDPFMKQSICPLIHPLQSEI